MINLTFTILVFSFLEATHLIAQSSKVNDYQNMYEFLLDQQIHMYPYDDDETFYGFPFSKSSLYDWLDFRKLYDHPARYFDCYVQVGHDPNLHLRYNKHYAMLAMQGADFELYLKVIRETYRAFQEQKVHVYTLDLAITY